MFASESSPCRTIPARIDLAVLGGERIEVLA